MAENSEVKEKICMRFYNEKWRQQAKPYQETTIITI